MIQTIPCPDAARLRALIADTDVPDYVDLEMHLAHCPRCQERLDELAVGESGWLRDAGRLAATPVNDAEMTKTLHRLRDEWPDDGAPIALDFLKPSDQPGLLGTLGRYQVLEVIGRGAFGIVLKAIDPNLLRPVAIKVLAPYLATSGTARQRFLREARAAAAVSHDHIVTIHAVEPGEWATLPYIVMEFISGISLQARLDRDGPLPPRDIARIGHQAACGLAAAHSVGLVHRDIKPANILLENGVERVKITDFGLARAADDARLTQSGTAAGTPLYMSPEQTRGEAVDQRSDLFSLGSVLYTMATGFPPFRAGSTMGVLNRIANDPPRPIRETVPDFPAALEAIIMQLLEKDPSGRYQLAADVSVRLSGFLADPRAEPYRRRRMPRWLETSLPILAGILVLGVVLYFKTRQGTLVVEVDDPDVKVALNGKQLKITGGGLLELSLDPGTYHVQAMKDGKPGKAVPEVVRIERGGKQIVKVTAIANPESEGEPDTETMKVELGRLMKELALSGKAKPGEMDPMVARLSALLMEASDGKTPPEQARQALLEAYKIGRDLSIPPKKADTGPSAPPPVKADPEWEAKLDKLTNGFLDLRHRLADTPVGSLFALPGPINDLDKAVAAVNADKREKAKQLLALRDQFALLLPKAQQAAVRLQELKGQLANTTRTLTRQDLESTYSTLSGLLKDMEKIAGELGAKPAKAGEPAPPPRPVDDPEAEYKKVTDDFDALVLRLAKTPVGRVLTVFKGDTVGDAELRETGVPDASFPTVHKLLALRKRINEQENEAQGSLYDIHYAKEQVTREYAVKNIKLRTATIRSLVDDLTKIADEIAPVPVPVDVEFKKVMAEYDALVLRLVDTPTGRILALVPPDRPPATNADLDAVAGTDASRRAQATRLVDLRGRILEQSGLAQKALTIRARAMKELADEPARFAKEGRAAQEEYIEKNEHEAKVRVTALRGLVADLKKLADELAPPKK